LVLLFPERAERYLNSKKYRKPMYVALPPAALFACTHPLHQC
jgi:hypothetical protein